MNMQRKRKEIYVLICFWKDMAIMQEDTVKFGVRTRKRNKSIKESAKLVSMSCSQFYICITVVLLWSHCPYVAHPRNVSQCQCCGSVIFWYGSRSADPGPVLLLLATKKCSTDVSSYISIFLFFPNCLNFGPIGVRLWYSLLFFGLEVPVQLIW